MKRTKRVFLTSVMLGAGPALAACGGDAAAPQWIDPPAASAPAVEDQSAEAYANLEECKSANVVEDAACESAYAAALAENDAQAPRFGDRVSCEEQYGVDQCVPRNNGSFFTPLLTGFIVGQALSDIGGRRYYGRPYYRDRYGLTYFSDGRRLSRDYVTGRYRVGREVYAPPRTQAPTRVQSRSAVISRGGFGGGGGRSFGG